MEYYSQENTSLSIWKAIFKKWFIILMAFAVGLGASIAYSVLKIKPIYTASTSVVLKLAVTGDITASNNTNNATLAKRNLPTVKACLISEKCALTANARYNQVNGTTGDNISKELVQVVYGDQSMIFTLGYSDLDMETAKAKLEAIIVTASEILAEEIEAEDVDLVPVQNSYDVDVSDKTATAIALGGLAGIALGIGIALLIFIMDNKIRNKEEIEKLTGINVIACVNSDVK